MTSLELLVQDWLRLDPNDKTRKEIQELWDAGNTAELEKRMRPRIEFGTAGLRARMEAGWSRMNDLIVLQTTQGLCAYILTQVADARNRGVVIGHDHRHNSEPWARLAAHIFMSRGVKTYLLKGLVHTPMVPFSVKKLAAACGIMITASHNPKQDNGYKVYWENASQIIGPHDKGISDSIKANLEPVTLERKPDLTSPLLEDRTEEMKEAYFLSLGSLVMHRSINETCKVKFVNTSMHGVGDRFVSQAFALFGLPPYIPVLAQQDPNPNFPTARFPNPEERGALDLAIQTANAEGANCVLAQDPDADRFAAAEKNLDGAWTIFTGDQLGTLFAAFILDQYRSNGKSLDKIAMVTSIVSSRMLEAMSTAEGFKFQDCLTGFKHIGNTALYLIDKGFEVPFGYEEAIGYMFGTVHDKDGVAASAFFAQLVAALYSRGATARSFLNGLYDKYGFFKTSNNYLICDDPQTIDSIFNRLRNFKRGTTSYPNEIAGLQVDRVIDFTTDYDSGNPPSYKAALSSSSGHMIQFRAGSPHVKAVLTIRTSGTEPKIKYYLEGNGKNRETVEEILPQVVLELERDWLEAERHSLGRP